MRIVLDACVLYPTVMREMIVGVAQHDLFVPLWSARILEEWARAAQKLGPDGELQARSEIALLEAAFPASRVSVPPGLVQRLWLPDHNDIHVLAAAVASSADAIMTLNAKDFPRQTLAEEGVQRLDPDGFLHSVWRDKPTVLEEVAAAVLAQARRLSGQEWEMRPLLKKARLPRCAKALSQT